MQGIQVFFRAVALYLILSFPFVLGGIMYDLVIGSIFGFLVGLIVFLGLAFFAEKKVISSHPVLDYPPRGLERTIERTEEFLNESGVLSVLVYSDPAPKALIAKSSSSNGSILLSQGLISNLNENELRQLLAHCRKHLDGFEPILSTMSSVMAHLFMNLSSDSWVHVFYLRAESNAQWKQRDLSPVSIFSFLIFYPLVRIFLALGRRNSISIVDQEIQHLSQRKLGRGWNQGYRPGLIHLYLSDPVIDLGGLAGPIK